MTLQAIGTLEAIQSQAAPAALTSAPGPAAPGFANWMKHELGALNTQLVSAEQGINKLASGTAENLHDVMLQLEQARLAMQVASQVRSKVLEAYQDVMRMQV